MKGWLTRKEAAAHLSSLGYVISPKTLSRYAEEERGPPFRRFIGRNTAYPRAELEAWAKENAVDFGKITPPAQAPEPPKGALSQMAGAK